MANATSAASAEANVTTVGRPAHSSPQREREQVVGQPVDGGQFDCRGGRAEGRVQVGRVLDGGRQVHSERGQVQAGGGEDNQGVRADLRRRARSVGG